MSISSSAKKYRVALVAHDACKSVLVDWVRVNIDAFRSANIYSTGTTGGRLSDAMPDLPHDVDVKALTRLATVYDLPMACSVATANLIADAIRDQRI